MAAANHPDSDCVGVPACDSAADAGDLLVQYIAGRGLWSAGIGRSCCGANRQVGKWRLLACDRMAGQSCRITAVGSVVDEPTGCSPGLAL